MLRRPGAQEGGIRRNSVICGLLTRSPGPRIWSWVGRTWGRADPAYGGPRDCHGGCRGHPQLAELVREHQPGEMGDQLLSRFHNQRGGLEI